MRSIIVFALSMLLAACGAQQAATPAATTAPAEGGRLVVMTHDSFSISPEVVAQFEQQTGATVQFLPSGDTGTALNKAILSKGSPQADVFFGVDNTFLSRALEAEIFEPYESPALATVPDQFKLDPSSRLLPIDYGYVSLNYDKAFLQQQNLAVPQQLEDLTRPEWDGALVVENPATSSPGLAFMLATIGYFGTEGDYTWLDFWADLRENDVLVTDGWEQAYNQQFSGSSGKGPRPLVVSYASSPPAEVIFAERRPADAPTGVITAGSFLQVEFAGILKGTQNRALAEQFVDFMLSEPFQQDVPLQMFVYPVQPDVALPQEFTEYSATPEQPLTVAPDAIEQNRQQWIEEWTRVVLR